MSCPSGCPQRAIPSCQRFSRSQLHKCFLLNFVRTRNSISLFKPLLAPNPQHPLRPNGAEMFPPKQVVSGPEKGPVLATTAASSPGQLCSAPASRAGRLLCPSMDSHCPGEQPEAPQGLSLPRFALPCPHPGPGSCPKPAPRPRALLPAQGLGHTRAKGLSNPTQLTRTEVRRGWRSRLCGAPGTAALHQQVISGFSW